MPGIERLEDRRLMAVGIAEYPLDPSSLSLQQPVVTPTNLTKGPDGNLWFTEVGTDKIGRITPTGTLVEFSIPPSFAGLLEGLTTGPDGNLWFTQQGGHPSIGRITPDGVVTEFPLSNSNDAPAQIVAGPDGNLWFTEPSLGKIGRITPTGDITEFSISTTNPYLSELTVGPDGNLWFIEPNADKIGRITPTGAVTEFSIPTANFRLGGLTVGSDGNLWFTELSAGKVGRITPSGEITEFSLPAGTGTASSPTDITAGPDGNLWVADSSQNAIDRITPSGEIKEFAVPASFGSPYSSGMIFGADGNLWIPVQTQLAIVFDASESVDDNYSHIIEMTPSGNFTEYATPSLNSGLSGFTAGPDGNLWFTETSTDRIGRVTLNTTDPAPTVAGAPIVATNETSFDGTVATFTDPDPTASPGDFLGQVDWGDGTTTDGTISADGHGGFIVQGDHSYAAGSYTAKVTVFDTRLDHGGAVSNTVDTTVNVANVGPTMQATNPTVYLGETDPIVVATASVNGFVTVGTTYYAAIDWGDGTPTTVGSVVFGTPEFQPGGVEPLSASAIVVPEVQELTIFGNHHYAAPGTYTVHVSLDDSVASPSPGLTETIQVLAPPINNPQGNNVSAVAGTPIGPVALANFTSARLTVSTVPVASGSWLNTLTPTIPPSQFPATIDWGDGTTSDGTVVSTGPVAGQDGSTVASYSISGGHTYAHEGTYTIHVTINNGTGQPVTVTDKATVAGAPLVLSGGLDPASDTGPSHSDGITDLTQPRFDGTAAPGATVQLFGQTSPGASPALIGQTVADASGNWSIVTNPLANGSYTITASETAPDGRTLGPVAITASNSGGPLVVDTTAPRVNNVSLDPRDGRLVVGYLVGPTGLDPQSVDNSSNYQLTNAMGRVVPLTSVSSVGDTVTLNVGHRLRPGRYEIRIASGGVRERAGEALDGEFRGTLPSGDGHPGGDFAAYLWVVGSRSTPPRPLPHVTKPVQTGHATPTSSLGLLRHARVGHIV